jgi:DNA replication and repair protein RecF
MIAQRLKVVNFRNFQETDFLPNMGVNILCGNNAQGKTNLIEAIWLFTGAHSFRGAKDPEMIRFGQKVCRLELKFSARGLQNDASLAFSSTKQASLNGVKLDSTTEFAGKFCAVVFSPEHLELVKSGPQQRRRFIDNAITEILPRHAFALLEYRELLRQRNALLKDIPIHSELLDTISVWDEKISQTGASIVFARLRYLKKLAIQAGAVYDGISEKPDNSENLIQEISSEKQPGEKLTLEYFTQGGAIYPCEISDAHSALPKIRAALASSLTSQRAEDIKNGYTGSGPHRDDIEINIGGLPARLYASQGQQRSAVLALKLAEAAVLKETIGEPPILLLDDVMSELDRYRQNYILNHIGGCQVFITCCDKTGLEDLEGGSVFYVHDGEILK